MEGGKDKSGNPVAIRMKYGINKVYYSETLHIFLIARKY